MDSMSPRIRVARQFFARAIPRACLWFDADPPITDPLKPEYRDEHGTEAIDSNLLVLLASLDYVKATNDRAWWKAHEEALRSVYRFYDSKRRDGFIVQNAFADWQDSVRREGRAFYTNLLYSVVSDRLATEAGWSIPASERESARRALVAAFRDAESGLFRSLAEHPQISVDGNLLAIDLGFFPASSHEARELYRNLKRHPLWRGPAGIPGQVTLPAYPASWKSLAVRVAGLRNYHEDLHWSWLMGLAGKVAQTMQDREEAERITAALETAARRDGAIGEIFRPEPGLPLWTSRFFQAEIPFSWGAAFSIDLARSMGA
jgi:hypothetical protein